MSTLTELEQKLYDALMGMQKLYDGDVTQEEARDILMHCDDALESAETKGSLPKDKECIHSHSTYRFDESGIVYCANCNKEIG